MTDPVEQVREALGKMTPGPWQEQAYHDKATKRSPKTSPTVRAPWPGLPHGTRTVARIGNGNMSSDSRRQEEQDAEGICTLRNHAPALLAEIDKLRDNQSFCHEDGGSACMTYVKLRRVAEAAREVFLDEYGELSGGEPAPSSWAALYAALSALDEEASDAE